MSIRFSRILGIGLLGLVAAVALLPEAHRIPVSGATAKDWNPKSFWYYPWGRSGTHKGIDIFAKEGTPVVAATQGLVVHTDVDSVGGNVVLVLGGKWRFHYYAHLHSIDAQAWRWVRAGSRLVRWVRRAMLRASRRICITRFAHRIRSRGCMRRVCRRLGISCFLLTRIGG
ncbi:M23 family metallopeptidase [Thiothrix subterranea]|uniref:M23 family metallopeptidase n=1 Tax=Thiothrix subterranea TaxID=2735563 RepID=UPI00280AC9AC|nr:M23 family metallopeptidase [Thiothrix subterranea]